MKNIIIAIIGLLLSSCNNEEINEIQHYTDDTQRGLTAARKNILNDFGANSQYMTTIDSLILVNKSIKQSIDATPIIGENSEYLKRMAISVRNQTNTIMEHLRTLHGAEEMDTFKDLKKVYDKHPRLTTIDSL
jgi:hypothetical protein